MARRKIRSGKGGPVQRSLPEDGGMNDLNKIMKTKPLRQQGLQIVDKVVSASNCWSHFVLSFKDINQKLQETAKTARKRGIFSLNLGQFLEIYTREC